MFNLNSLQVIANWSGLRGIDSKPDLIDTCKHCGAGLYDHPEFDKPKWENDCWTNCLHERLNDATS